MPYAKSKRARRALIALAVAQVVGLFLFGLLSLVVFVPLMVVASRRLEHHPGRDRYRRRQQTAHEDEQRSRSDDGSPT